MLDLCRTPELAAEVTLQPVRASGSMRPSSSRDLLLPLEPLGLPFDFVKGEGPQSSSRSAPPPTSIACNRLRPAREARARPRGHPAGESRARTVGCRSSALPARRSRWRRTPSRAATRRTFAHTKALMYGDPRRLASPLRAPRRHRRPTTWRAQVEAGADAVQVFDSWVGALVPGRLPRVRPAAHAADLRRLCATPACPPSTSAPAPATLLELHGRGGRRRGRRRLAHAARRCVGDRSARTAPSRATSTRRCCSRPLDRLLGGRDRRAPACGGPAGTRLQPRPRHPAGDAGRAGRGAD